MGTLDGEKVLVGKEDILVGKDDEPVITLSLLPPPLVGCKVGSSDGVKSGSLIGVEVADNVGAVVSCATPPSAVAETPNNIAFDKTPSLLYL